MGRIFFSAILLLCIASVVIASGASAGDSFHADIAVHEDSSLTVTETIHIESGNNWFTNTIDRQVPSAQRKIFGLRYSKGFQLLECLRDGRHEKYEIFGDNGLLIRIGDFMDPNPVPEVRTYTLKYRLGRQIESSAGGDRLTWTVTDKYWGWWPVNVSASVRLPSDAAAHVSESSMTITDREGREETTAPAAEAGSDGVLQFAAPRELAQDEVFSVSLTWPGGYLKQPQVSAVIRQFAADNTGVLIGIGGLAALLVYYLIAWLAAGKGPAKGAMVVRYGPPDGMSPAVMRYILKMGYDDRCFAAALLNMAAKGHLRLWENPDRHYILSRTQGKAPLSADEEKIMGKLLPKGGDLNLEMEERLMSSATEALMEHLRLNFEKAFFIGNLRLFGVGLLISAATVVASGLGYLTDPLDMVLFAAASVVLTVGSPPFLVAAIELLKRWRAAFASGGARGIRIGKAIVFTVVGVFIGDTSFGALSMMTDMTSPYMLVLLAAAVAINYVFYQIMKAPTRAGRQLHDSIEGFREFLAMTEQDRMTLLEPPDRTPELISRYLPYALALGLEQEWSEQFSDVLGGTALSEAGDTLAVNEWSVFGVMGKLLRSP